MKTDLVSYKNFQISSELIRVIKYMESVEDSRELLQNLSASWDSLALLSQLGDAGVNMNTIKNNFSSLSSELINYLASEILKKSVDEMNSKAQVAVDIVIRNLFERTADIGFLATDEKIRQFLSNNLSKYSPGYGTNLQEIQKRFLEYIEKYSVYFDIVLMNPKGEILANIDPQNNIDKSHDSLITQVIQSSQEYVETYKYHDFLPKCNKSLVYSCKVTQNDNPDSEVLGVLCLCFKFEDEMKEVFKNIINTHTKECITLLDKESKVIATSDMYHIPLGAELEKVVNNSYKLVSFGGRDYLATSCKTNGYQGFYGLGWYGHIMVPLEYAFTDFENKSFDISQELLLAILQNSNQFSKQLKNIPIQAQNIQNNLNRAIWNGNIKQSNSKNNNKQFSRALLKEIRNTGENTKAIIGSSMANLTKTMVLGDNVFLADLILDIMDRNLYERANDCRWWALTPDFRKILQNEYIEDQERIKMTHILKYINSLYTVYTNLFIYDKNGVIISVSNTQDEYLIGKKLSQEWVQKTLKLSDSSKYFVSNFEKTPLYKDNYTYIYNAAIRSIENEQHVLGGIGIVFDSKVQFEAMIHEALPKLQDGKSKDGLFSVLATKDQIVIASNNHEYETGSIFKIDSKFFQLECGESLSEIIEFQGKYYALGVKCSKGYREYKGAKDDYINNVYNFLFSYISDVADTKLTANNKFALDKDLSIEIDENSIDIASFMIGNQWLGLEACDVIEAVNINELQSTIKMDNDHHFKGTVLYKENIISVIDIKNFIQEEHSQAYEEIVIIKFGFKDRFIGLLVNSLSDIPEVHLSRIRPLEENIVGEGTLVKSVVFPVQGTQTQEVLSILNIQKMSTKLLKPEQTYMLTRKIPSFV